MAHRYWRIKRLASIDSNFVSIKDIWFDDVLPTGGAAIFSSEYIAGWAEYAFDGISGNEWLSSSGSVVDAYIGYDFGTPIDVSSIKIAGAGAGIRTPTEFAIEYSDDGAAWTEAVTHSPGAWDNNEVRTFEVPSTEPAPDGHHRYWRIRRIDNPDGNYTGVNDLYFNGVLPTGGTPIFSTQYATSGDNSAAGAFDGDSATQWVPEQNQLENAYIGYDFGEPVEVTSITIDGSVTPAYTPTVFAIEYSDDNIEWTTAVIYGPISWAANETKEFSALPPEPAPEGHHRYWRVYGLTTFGYSQYIVAGEIEFRGEIGGDDLTNTIGGVPIGVSDLSSDVSAAFDEQYNDSGQSDGTYWFNDGWNGWVGWDFGAGNEQSIVEVAIYASRDTVRAMRSFAVEYSDDGVNWQPAWQEREQPAWPIGTWREFANPFISAEWQVKSAPGYDQLTGEALSRDIVINDNFTSGDKLIIVAFHYGIISTDPTDNLTTVVDSETDSSNNICFSVFTKELNETDQNKTFTITQDSSVYLNISAVIVSGVGEFLGSDFNVWGSSVTNAAIPIDTVNDNELILAIAGFYDTSTPATITATNFSGVPVYRTEPMPQKRVNAWLTTGTELLSGIPAAHRNLDGSPDSTSAARTGVIRFEASSSVKATLDVIYDIERINFAFDVSYSINIGANLDVSYDIYGEWPQLFPERTFYSLFVPYATKTGHADSDVELDQRTASDVGAIVIPAALVAPVTPDFWVAPLDDKNAFAHSYYFDWYDRVWISPTSFELKNPKLNTPFEFSLFNAFAEANTLNTIDFVNVTGVELNIEAPRTFGPLEEVVTSFEIQSSAPSVINGDIVFAFDYASVELTLNISIVNFVGVTPEVPIRETLSWYTSIMSAKNATEQRRAMRRFPRRSLEFDVVIENERQRVARYKELYTLVGKTIDVPLYQYATQITAAGNLGDMSVKFDPAHTDVRIGENIAIVDPQTEGLRILSVATIEADGVTLASPLDGPILPGFYVMPAVPTRYADGSGLVMRSVSGALTVRAETVSYRPLVRPGAVAVLTMLDGRPVLDRRPLANEAVEETFSSNYEVFDNSIGEITQATSWEHNFVGGPRQFLIHRVTNPADMDYWRLFLDTIRGSQKAFYLPTFRNDLELASTPVLGSNTFETVNTDYVVEYFPFETYKAVMILTRNGPLFAQVTEAVVSGDTATVTITPPLGQNEGDNDIISVSYLNLSRLNNDDVEFEHGHLDTTVTLNYRAIDG